MGPGWTAFLNVFSSGLGVFAVALAFGLLIPDHRDGWRQGVGLMVLVLGIFYLGERAAGYPQDRLDYIRDVDIAYSVTEWRNGLAPIWWLVGGFLGFGLGNYYFDMNDQRDDP